MLQTYLNRILQSFPDLTISSSKFISHGWDHDVVLVNDEIIFRFPKQEEYEEWIGVEGIYLNEIRTQLDHHILMPDYTYLPEDKSFGGYKKVPGNFLTKDYFESLSEKHQEQVVTCIGSFLSTLHSLPISLKEKYHLNSTTAESYEYYFEQVQHDLFPRLNKEEQDMVTQTYSKLIKHCKHAPRKCIIHHDLRDNHMLYDQERGTLGVIDFSDAAYADPAQDFAGLFVLGEETVEKVLQNYTQPIDNEFTLRASLYYQRIPISYMWGASVGRPCDFEEWRAVFRKRFL